MKLGGTIRPQSTPNYAIFGPASDLDGATPEKSPLNISSYSALIPDEPNIYFSIESLYIGCVLPGKDRWTAAGVPTCCRLAFPTRTAATGGKLGVEEICEYNPSGKTGAAKTRCRDANCLRIWSACLR